MTHQNHIVVLDFGSQYTQLIARRIREIGVYCEILPHWTPLGQVLERKPKGIILSGGPRSVYEPGAPLPHPDLLKTGVPVLGICYGMQALAQILGGRVARASQEEYGPRSVEIVRRNPIFKGLRRRIRVWMSHADYVEALPRGWKVIGRTETCPYAAATDRSGRILGVQFHPEVSHTDSGTVILKNFVLEICNAPRTWSMESFVEETVESIRATVGGERVLCALSGGVDSSVTAVLVGRAVGERLTCIYVNNGLMRKNEPQGVRLLARTARLKVRYVNAAQRFLSRLRGVTDPEVKRRVIGHEFIRVFEESIPRHEPPRFLAQGTLYPDVIESMSHRGPSDTIKSHHNVGGLPRKMKLRLIEPLRELFKDEVRKVGKIIGIPEEILRRHPFPGPGLAVRIIGEVTRSRLQVLREVDWIVVDELKKAGLYDEIWQAFAVLLPVRTVGVMGDRRTYQSVVAIRAVTSRDGMTADWARIPDHVLETIATRIVNSVKQVNRVVYDVTSKPPGTIEWE